MEERPWHGSYDRGVPRRIDYEALPVTAFLERSAERHGDATALIFLNARMSYAELAREVARCATALARLGVGPGSKVAIQLPNLPQTVIAYYAILSLGGVVVMTNPLYTPREIEHQWTDAGCELAVVADFIFEQKLRAIRDELPVRNYVIASISEYVRAPLRWIVPFALRRQKHAPIASVAPGEGIHFFRELVDSAPPKPPHPAIDLDEVAVLQYTGGTTGVSKGAALTHRNLSCNVQQVNTWFLDVQIGKEVILTALPLFHVFGMTVAMNWAVLTAAAQVILPDPRSVARLVKSIEKHRVSLFPAVPAMFNAINNFPGIGGRDLSSVKSCFSGSAPLPVDVLERFEKLTGARILEGFGLTETSPVTHVNPMEGARKIGSIGIPVSDTDARVVDADGGLEEKPVGEHGELLIKGPQVMQGYWNMPEESAGTFEDGWLRTGDLASMDEEGYFRIVGRKKDMIIAGGYNVYPDEIDDILMAHPDVLEAATIGVPDERRGETVKSFVVPQPGSRLTAEVLEAYCRDNLAAYKVPRAFEFLDELPKSTVLKVLRRELRDREIAKLEGK
ncbi:MAG: long-chain fatty acid--CoA ligase [Planctomycetota bacterium]|nr:long-chain fatty acid--CoA ligase [Planctomycetota bacterium]